MEPSYSIVTPQMMSFKRELWWVSRGSCESFGRLRLFKDALLSRPWERKCAGAQDLYTIRCVVGCSEAPTCTWAPKAHNVASKKQERHCARSSGTSLLVLEQTRDKFFDRRLLAIITTNSPLSWSSFKYTRMSLNECRYRTPSKLETLF